MAQDHIKDAMDAACNLNTFAAVVEILEGGCVYGGMGSEKVSARIIKICQAEQQRLLRKMDASRAAAAPQKKEG